MLRGECEQSEVFDAVVTKALDHAPYVFGASAMAEQAWTAALFGPPSIAVHDYRDVSRYSSESERRWDLGLRARNTAHGFHQYRTFASRAGHALG